MKFLFDNDVPDDLSFSLETLGHSVIKLRDVRPTTIADDEVLLLAGEMNCLLITCNRDDFLELAKRIPHRGMIILIRRKSRTAERAALIRLLDSAGESGLQDNVNFA